MSKVQKAIDLLGRKATDRVSGMSGVITTIGFDLYGCLQAAITPPAKEGKYESGNWFDLNRLEISDDPPVMANPFARPDDGDALQHENGPAEKPSIERQPLPRP